MSNLHLRVHRRSVPSYLLPVRTTGAVRFATDLHTAGEQTATPNEDAALLELRVRTVLLLASEHRQTA